MVFKKCAWFISFNLKVLIFIDIVDDYFDYGGTRNLLPMLKIMGSVMKNCGITDT